MEFLTLDGQWHQWYPGCTVSLAAVGALTSESFENSRGKHGENLQNHLISEVRQSGLIDSSMFKMKGSVKVGGDSALYLYFIYIIIYIYIYISL